LFLTYFINHGQLPLNTSGLLSGLLGGSGGALNQLFTLNLEELSVPPANLTMGNYSLMVKNGTIKGLNNIANAGDISLLDQSTLVTLLTAPLNIDNVTVDLDVGMSMDQVNWQDGNVLIKMGRFFMPPVLRVEPSTQDVSLEDDNLQMNVENVNMTITGLKELIWNRMRGK
jgi:hypothetical protein